MAVANVVCDQEKMADQTIGKGFVPPGIDRQLFNRWLGKAPEPDTRVLQLVHR